MSAGARLPAAPEPMAHWETPSGVTIAGDVWGDVSGPVVVLQHGGGQTRHAWKGTGETLAAAGYRAVALDARGHGDSSWAEDGDYTQDAQVEDLVAVLEQIGGDRPVLVGASMGGGTSLVAVGEGHVDAAALVLVDIAPAPGGRRGGQDRCVHGPGRRRLRLVGRGRRRDRRLPAAPAATAPARRAGQERPPRRRRALPLALGSGVPRSHPRPRRTSPSPGGVRPQPRPADVARAWRVVGHPHRGGRGGVPHALPGCRVREHPRCRAHGRRRPQRRVRRSGRRLPAAPRPDRRARLPGARRSTTSRRASTASPTCPEQRSSRRRYCRSLGASSERGSPWPHPRHPSCRAVWAHPP